MSDNMRIWDALGKTDPYHTKQFKRAGGFSGTAVKPMWVNKRLTEKFGPAGIGWGMDKPSFDVVNGNNAEILVYCTVSGWYMENGVRCSVWGVGGDKVVSYIKANEQYNRPERWENDDEAFKKAFTDALGNAFKFVGVGADVHMGQFDDSKYVQEVGAKFERQNNPLITEAQKMQIEVTASDVAADMPKFLKFLKVAKLEDLPASQYDKAIKALEGKRTKPQESQELGDEVPHMEKAQ